MAFNSGTIANISLTGACLVVMIMGGLRIHERFSSVSQNSLQANPITDIDAEFSIAEAQVAGGPSAEIALVEFSDYECPFCAKFANETYGLLKTEFMDSQKIKFIAMNLPLDIHPQAHKASQAAECAGDQGRFWDMRTRLFSPPSNLTMTAFREHAKRLRLEPTKFTRCIDNGENEAKVNRQKELAARLGIKNTPTFVLGRLVDRVIFRGRKKIVGAQSVELFRVAIDQVLDAAD